MGGVPPLGYEVRGRKLAIIEREAESVRHIFRRYALLGSVRLLQQELTGCGFTGKSWTSAAGRSWGGKPISRGALYLILQNRIYRGEVVHKGQAYPGEHQGIIDPVLWDAVQARLVENTAERRTGSRLKNASLLAGLLFDGQGQRMTPTHAVKNGRRYRYYVSRPLIVESRADAAAGLRIPAADIEQIVVNRMRGLLAEPARLFEVFEAQVGERLPPQDLVRRATECAESWVRMSPLRRRVVLLALVHRVDICRDRVIIHLRPHRLLEFLEDRQIMHTPDPVDGAPTLAVAHSVRLQRAGKEVRMVIDQSDPFAPPPKPDPSLVKAIVRAHRFNNRLLHGGAAKFADLAKSESLHRSYYSQILRLAYLAPDITTAIFEGRQPSGLSATMLIEHPRIPLSWQEQRTALGFAQADPNLIRQPRTRATATSGGDPPSPAFGRCINAPQRYSGRLAHSTAVSPVYAGPSRRIAPTNRGKDRSFRPGPVTAQTSGFAEGGLAGRSGFEPKRSELQPFEMPT